MKKYLSRFFAAMMAIASIGIAVAQTEGAGAGSGGSASVVGILFTIQFFSIVQLSQHKNKHQEN